jgi:PAS domain S-box-containing protein
MLNDFNKSVLKGVPTNNAVKKSSTELVQEVQALKKTVSEKDYLEDIYHSIGQSVLLLDPDQNILSVNLATEKITGLSANELKGKKCYQVFHGSETTSHPASCPFQRLLTTENVEVEEMEVETLGGTFLISCTPIFDDHSKLKRIIHIATDISEKKAIESQLHQSWKMESIGTLAGGIAHDFNNLLYMISGNAELALEDIPKWNPVHTNLEEIKSASLRAAGIVKQLLNFSQKTDKGLKQIGAVTVIKENLKFLRSTIPTTIEIRKHLPDEDITILADPVQVNQVLMNLCINASQAMVDTGGILEVNVEKTTLEAGEIKSFVDLTPGKYFKMTVSDTGPGIAIEIVNRIFDPYFTTKEMGKGSGMGLSVVHGIVQNHNGAISVDSKLGKGAAFSIFFPMVDEKPKIETETIGKIPRGHETILFVDDEEPIVTMTQKMLKRLGYRVETCLNPVQALDLFKSKPDTFDLVITDMTMPLMTGAKLSKKLMEIRSDIPVIICTGHSSLIDEEKAKQLGIAGYVMKPVSLSGIAKAIRKILDK